jgi:hypothetical protein
MKPWQVRLVEEKSDLDERILKFQIQVYYAEKVHRGY